MTISSFAPNAPATALAVAMTAVMFYVPGSAAMPASMARTSAAAPSILYVEFGDPARTICGIWDGGTMSGVIYCNGDHVGPDDPRFPRTRRMAERV